MVTDGVSAAQEFKKIDARRIFWWQLAKNRFQQSIHNMRLADAYYYGFQDAYFGRC
jgi:hypothetical protein